MKTYVAFFRPNVADAVTVWIIACAPTREHAAKLADTYFGQTQGNRKMGELGVDVSMGECLDPATFKGVRIWYGGGFGTNPWQPATSEAFI